MSSPSPDNMKQPDTAPKDGDTIIRKPVYASSVNDVPVDWINLIESSEATFGQGKKKNKPAISLEHVDAQALAEGRIVVGRKTYVSLAVLAMIPVHCRPSVLVRVEHVPVSTKKESKRKPRRLAAPQEMDAASLKQTIEAILEVQQAQQSLTASESQQRQISAETLTKNKFGPDGNLLSRTTKETSYRSLTETKKRKMSQAVPRAAEDANDESSEDGDDASSCGEEFSCEEDDSKESSVAELVEIPFFANVARFDPKLLQLTMQDLKLEDEAELEMVARTAKGKTRILEKFVELALHIKIGGQRQVRCRFGVIDLAVTTPEGLEVIEIKEESAFKSAVGQVVAYRLCFPGSKAVLYLFNRKGKSVKAKFRELAEELCAELQIDVRYHDFSAGAV